MKCKYYEKHKMSGPWGTGNGFANFQCDALITHKKLIIHKDTKGRWFDAIERRMKSIPDHIIQIEDGNRERVITTMKVAYFICQEYLCLSKYEKLGNFLIGMKTPTMPKSQYYNSYTNHKATNDFLYCILEYIERYQTICMLESPFFSLMVHESTDHTLEKHLVVYATYLDLKGLEEPIS